MQSRRYVFPASYAQQRLWVLDQLDPSGAAYNVPSALRIRGALDVPALERALDAIVARHEVLRTVFATRQAELVQVVSPHQPVLVPLVALHRDEAARELQLAEHVAIEARRRFDLRNGPLFRVQLLQLAELEHVLVFNLHHIVTDGWSFGVLMRDLRALYAAFSLGQPDPLPPLKLQYADFAVWQREWLSSESCRAQVAFWKEQLAGLPSALDLPTDHARPKVASFAGASLPLSASSTTRARLEALATSEATTSYVVWLALFAVLLHRWSGQNDVAIGTVAANRNHVDLEPLIGYFVNTLPLRISLTDSPTFVEVVRRARRVFLDAMANQDLPFDQLVKEVAPERDATRAPIFQVSFAYQKAPRRSAAGEQLSLEPLHVSHTIAKFDLTLNLIDDEQKVEGLLEYSTDLFERESAARLASQLERLLSEVCRDPAQRIGQLRLLSEEERRQQVEELNETSREYGRGTLLSLVEERARVAGESLALDYGAERRTYAELVAGARRVSELLRSLGVSREVRVAVALPRSVELVEVVLGIWGAGGVYVPLDLKQPPERQAYVLADSGAAFVVTRGEELLASSATVIDLSETTFSGSSSSSSSELTSEQAAYVIYTSGSTGRAKGVLIEHGSYWNLVKYESEAFGLGSGGRVLQFSTTSFDAWLWELGLALGSGATLCFVGEAAQAPGRELYETLKRERIGMVTLPPSALSVMPREALPELATLVVAGEACEKELSEHWGAGRRFVNAYGPTETTVCATLTDCGDGVQPPLMGAGIGNTRVYVLDAEQELVPLGVIGELCVGGASLARGYLGRGDLTAERFIPNPFSTRGERLYRTGDRARWARAGQLEYRGRTDRQVKLRGYRIELGEVEAGLRAEAGIEQAVVELETQGDDKRLVGYYESSEAYEEAALKAQLRQRLPEYMVPAVLVHVAQLPLTASGKLDRARLKAMSARSESSSSYRAPTTPLQHQIAAMFEELLGLQQVGLDAHFFELGGHSLLAARLVTRLQQVCGVAVSLARVFELPTVAAIAAQVAQAQTAGVVGERIEAIGREQPLLLSFAQQRLLTEQRLRPSSVAYNVPLVVRLRGELDLPALCRAFERLQQRHEILRTLYPLLDGEPVQVISESPLVSLVSPRLSSQSVEARESELNDLVARSCGTPFALEREASVRACIVVEEDLSHVLVMCLHHIAVDGVSLGVLVGDLEALYRAERSHSPSALPPLPIQYADYAAWLRRKFSGAALSDQLQYWRTQLEGASSALDLPVDRVRISRGSRPAGSVGFVLPGALAERARQYANACGTTPFVVLLSAFYLLLRAHAGQKDVTIGVPVSHRTRPELEPLVGFFVNTMPVRIALDSGESFAAVVAEVAVTTQAAYAHQDVPFEQIVNGLGKRAHDRQPLFQVLFSLAVVESREPGFDELQVQPLDASLGQAKYDLTLVMSTQDGGLSGSFEYDAAIFDRTTVEAYARRFATLLESALRSPTLPSERLRLLEPSEQQALLERAGNRSEAMAGALLHERFWEHARLHPNRVALWSAEREWTYGELGKLIERARAVVERRGARPEVRVGICMRRSVDMVACWLGVWSAGAACVPLPPELPAARLDLIARDAGVRFVLTDANASVVGQLGVPLVDASAALAAEPSVRRGRAPAACSSQSLAYIIYTSGSTGMPKGVCVPHGGLANLAAAAQASFELGPATRVLQFSSSGFDAFVLELAESFGAGGSLCVPDSATVLVGQELWDVLRRSRASLVLLPPSVLATLPRESLPDLTTLLVGGEACPSELARGWLAMPGLRLFNAYGPTECTVCATWTRCSEDCLPPAIGAALPGHSAYVLSSALELVPSGVVGELCVGGIGVARGYQDRADLTAERFVPDPFSSDGARLYRTGDLVRCTVARGLEFVGRRDFQVKLRGHRIELGEIEAAARALPGVRDAAALVSEGEPGEKRLFLYVVPHDAAAETDQSELRELLGERLPPYMLPHAVVVLEALPLNASGKLARERLPLPSSEHLARSEFVEPSTPAELELAAIWSAVLSVERIGIHDDFLGLGGDSILAIQVASRARSAGIEVTPASLLELRTVARLAATARRAEVDPVLSAPWSGELPLSPIQRWFFERIGNAPQRFNMAVMLKLNEPLELNELDAALAAVLTQHDAFWLRFSTRSGAWTQSRVATSELRAPLRRESTRGLSSVQRVARLAEIVEGAHVAIDIERGPLLSCVHVDGGGEGDDRLLVVAHHLVMDSVSLRIFFDDLQTAYQAALHAGALVLPGRTATLKAWNDALTRFARSDVGRTEASFWLGCPARVARLKRDADGPNTARSERRSGRSLGSEATGALLRELPARTGASAATILTSVLVDVLSEWLGPLPILLDIEGHGREEPGFALPLDRTIGWLTSLQPVWFEPDPSESVELRLKRVREQLAKVPRHGLAYGAARSFAEDAELRAALSSLPEAELRFEYLGQLEQGLAKQASFEPAPESVGAAQAEHAPRPHLLACAAAIAGGKLSVSFSYSSNVHLPATIEGLLDRYMARLEATLTELSRARRAYECAEFPRANLDGATLRRIVERIEAVNQGEIEDIHPLTPMQQSMLEASLAMPGSGVYSPRFVVPLPEPWDASRVEQAAARVVARHAVLRTVFVTSQAAEPLAVVLASAPVRVRQRALTSHPEEHHAALQRLLEEEGQLDFALDQGPLLRLSVCRSGARSLLLLHVHHLLLDGWSTSIVLSDLFAACAGRPFEERRRPSFAEFTCFQRGARSLLAAEFWRRELREHEPFARIRVDSRESALGAAAQDPAPRAPTSGIGSVAQRLDEQLCEQLLAAARRYRVTIGTFCDAAWAWVLRERTAHQVVAFGAIVAGRSAQFPEVEDVVGMCVTVIPRVISFPPAAPLKAWLEGMQQSAARASEYEHVSELVLRAALQVPSGPLFESVVLYENFPISDGGRAALDETLDRPPGRDDKAFPIEVVVTGRRRFVVELRHHHAAFDSDDARRLSLLFVRALAALSDPMLVTIDDIAGSLTRREECAD